MNRTIAARWSLQMTCLGTLALALFSCGSTQDRLDSVELPIESPGVALVVNNFRGSVEVRIDPRLASAVVESSVHADESIDSKQREPALNAVNVDAVQTEQHGYSIVTVTTTSARAAFNDHRVDLKITLPRCDGLDITNTAGDVVVVDTAGATRITNHQGAVEFRSSKPIAEPATITTTDGNIYYQVTPACSAAFDIETLDGRVEFKDSTSGAEKVYSTQTVYKAQLNKGTNPVVLRTNRGYIYSWVMEDPVAFTRVWKGTPADPLDYIHLQGSNRYLRNLPEDHPEVQSDIGSDPLTTWK
ncbi:MAG TPA: DUF4097 family beta strand repeat-containing protein [Phycisphaerales bacterium]|nr:DUF4097 family beta strand repeat-containing protein [Phycisphaerales bacterium]